VAKRTGWGRNRAALSVPLVGVALLAAACGSGGSKAASAVTTTTVAGRGAGLQAFRQCMAARGVNVPQRQRPAGAGGGATAGAQPPDTGAGPGGQGADRFSQPPPGVDPAKYQAALTACRPQLPAAGTGNAQSRTAFVAYVTCLRNHGVATGDPSQANQALAGVDRNSATFQAADQQCRALLPQRGPGPTTTTTA